MYKRRERERERIIFLIFFTPLYLDCQCNEAYGVINFGTWSI